MMEHFSFMASVSNFNDPIWQTLIDAVALVFAIIGPPSLVSLSAHLTRRPRKRLSYQTDSDAALVDLRKDLGEDMTVTLKGGALPEATEVDDARLIMFKLTNTGSETIQKEDFYYDEQHKLRFEFDEPKLILSSIHHTEPDNLIPLESRQNMLKLDPIPPDKRGASVPASGDRPSWLPPFLTGGREEASRRHTPALHKYVDLDGRTLERNNSIVLKFVTKGRVPMRIQGRLLEGQIVPYSPPPPVFTITRLVIGFAITIVCLLGYFTYSSFQQNNCVFRFSSVKVGGSSAFFNTANNFAGPYHQNCPLNAVNVDSSNSDQGQTLLIGGNLDVADSELPCTGNKNLTSNKVVTIVFAVIVNKSVIGVHSLTREQITNIYDGKYDNWKRVGGPDLPIALFGRSPGSGTQAAFISKVLLPDTRLSSSLAAYGSTQEVLGRVANTNGAIGYVDLGSAQSSDAVQISIGGIAPLQAMVQNGQYPFSATEYMCTRNNNPNNDAANAFITYVKNHIMTSDAMINITTTPSPVVSANK